MRGRTLGWLAAAAALSLGGATPGAAQRPEVEELRFEGAESFTDAELSSAIVTTGTRCRNPVYLLICWAGPGREKAYLERGALEADAFRLKVYYYERGFREAQIEADTTRADEGVEVRFRIQEGRPVRVERVVLMGAPETLSYRDLPIEEGDPFDVVAYEATRDTLLNRLRDGGFARAQVLIGYTISSATPYQATVQYEVAPGPPTRFGRIRVEGNEEASPELVRRMLTFEEGDPYDRSAMLRSQRNLYGLQIFRHAIVEADMEAGTDSVVPIRIRVAEGDMRRVRLGAGADNIECVNVEGRWTSRNFLGDGRRFSVTGRVGNILIDHCDLLVDDVSYRELTGVLSADFTQPWFFGPRNNIGVGVFTERRSLPEVFVRTAYGGYLAVGRSLSDHAAVSLAYRPEVTELSTFGGGNLFFCVNFVGCTFEAVDVLSRPHSLSPVTLSLTLDHTDAVLAPSSGYIVRADIEHAGSYTLSDFAYTRFIAEGSAYLGEEGGVVLATRLRGGAGWAHPGGLGSDELGLNPQKRFFAGGPNSVRGFDQYRLGPTVLGIDAVPWLIRADDPDTAELEGAGCTAAEVNALTCDVAELARVLPGRFDRRPSGGEILLEGNLELRFPLPVWGSRLRGVAFVDAGQVWRTRSDLDLGDIVATPGFGVRYYSPVGPIRIDAAFDPTGPQELRVLTTRVEECTMDQTGCQEIDGRMLRNTDTVAPLVPSVSYGRSLDEMSGLRDFIRRFNLQFSIGQAF